MAVSSVSREKPTTTSRSGTSRSTDKTPKPSPEPPGQPLLRNRCKVPFVFFRRSVKWFSPQRPAENTYQNDKTEDRLFGGICRRRFFCKSDFWTRDSRIPSSRLGNGLSDQESGGHISGEHFIRSLFCHLSGGDESVRRTVLPGQTRDSNRERAHSRPDDQEPELAAAAAA